MIPELGFYLLQTITSLIIVTGSHRIISIQGDDTFCIGLDTRILSLGGRQLCLIVLSIYLSNKLPGRNSVTLVHIYPAYRPRDLKTQIGIFTADNTPRKLECPQYALYLHSVQTNHSYGLI